MSRLTRAIAAAALALAAAMGSAGAQAQCAGFADVPTASGFCPNVEWVRNRGVTLGCGDGSNYCPDQPVIRLAMAAFMNRLGTALTPVQLRVDTSPGAIDLDANAVFCQTTPQAIAGFPRRAYVDLSLGANATADVGFAADVVASTNGGAAFNTLNAVANRGSVAANQWATVADLGFVDLAVGDNVVFGVRMSRGGIAGTADLADSRCQLRVLLFSRDGTSSPF